MYGTCMAHCMALHGTCMAHPDCAIQVPYNLVLLADTLDGCLLVLYSHVYTVGIISIDCMKQNFPTTSSGASITQKV